MDLWTVDYESFYGDGYTLSSMTTEAYVRDPRFETIMVGLKLNKEKSYWVPGPEVGKHLKSLRLERCAVLCHHTHFDGLITSYHYAIRPKVWFDTMGMARALHGANGRLSLDKLAERYGIGKKGDEVMKVRNMHFADFTPDALARYGGYCCNDVDLTYELFLRMQPRFSRYELELNDSVIRMFTEPEIVLNVPLLQGYVEELQVEKQRLMLEAGVTLDDLMSNDRFAEALRYLGVEPPMKISPSWLKKSPGERDPEPVMVYAFAKTDEAMQELQEHEDERVQLLVEARLKNKTTIAQKGAERMIAMAGRGRATVYLKYSGASGTHRLSAGDKINWQALKRGSKLREAFEAPEGHVVLAGDSSNIEARLLDWLAGQEDMVEAYRAYDRGEGPDIYCVMAEKIYHRPIVKKADPDARQMGKRVKLAFGFGQGAPTFRDSVRREAKEKVKDAEGNVILNEDGTPKERPLVLEIGLCQEVCDIYRASHQEVQKLWNRCTQALFCIARGEEGVAVDYRGIVRTCKDGLQLPGGLQILYPELKRAKDEQTGYMEWTFWNGKHREKLYGSKVTENIIQALARLVVMEQCMALKKAADGLAKWVHSVHDEGVFVVPLFEAPYVRELLVEKMRTAPSWAPDLPLNCEVGFHRSYGKMVKH
jgi:DNA polymerase